MLEDDETGFGILDDDGQPIPMDFRLNYYDLIAQPDWSKIVVRPCYKERVNEDLAD